MAAQTGTVKVPIEFEIDEASRDRVNEALRDLAEAVDTAVEAHLNRLDALAASVVKAYSDVADKADPEAPAKAPDALTGRLAPLSASLVRGWLRGDEDRAFDFDREDDGTLPLESAVGQALGFASVAWDGGTVGTFQEGRVLEAQRMLMERIEREIQIRVHDAVASERHANREPNVPHVEIGGVRMTEQQFNAARFPLTTVIGQAFQELAPKAPDGKRWRDRAVERVERILRARRILATALPQVDSATIVE